MDIAAASYIMCMEKAEGRGFNIIRISRFLNISPRACFFLSFKFSKEVKLIILINGTPHQKRETLIKNGDIVTIFPTLAGG